MTAAAVQLIEQQYRQECFDRWKLRKEAERQQRVEDIRQAAGPAPIKNRILARYHYVVLCKALEREYAEREKRDGEWQALYWLEAFEENYLRLNIPMINVGSHDKALKDAAGSMARKCERALLADIARHREGRTGADACRYALEQVEIICRGAGVNMPNIADCNRDDKHKVAAVVMRLCDAKWWRGQIRKAQARQLETAARRLGLTCKRTGGYASGLTVMRRRQQKRRNRTLLENLIAENGEGQTYTLAELSDLGISNPVNRRNELMARMRGCMEWAQDYGDNLQAVFLTGTCPSRFHAYNRGGKRYKNWDGSTPIDAQKWLNKRWQLLRAYYEKRGIRFYGLRIVEPHHDGCPHWHMVLWFDRRQLKLAMVLFQEVWRGIVRPRWVAGKDGKRRIKAKTGLCNLNCAGGEPGADKRRTKIVYMKKDDGGAVGYVAKYVSKNIDGMATVTKSGEEIQQEWSLGSVRTAERIEAWASTWGIRQFQAVGQPSVTVWRELRRVDAKHTTFQGEKFEEARAAADAGSWCEFMRAMGGPMRPRAEAELSPVYREAEKPNGYGEIVKVLEGIGGGVQGVEPTRLREWNIYALPKVSAAARPQAAQGPPQVAA
ncbi:replication endonuclease [uncultured Microbulbifer sp.]|uniref:replication endonuclease n=1 Tax=uncultured Microbulbifer sp. TaxID=348147 RepID=UPI002628A54B|nr:replication endonuclease [uncultured Microbulbifer sp.]